MKLLMIDFKKFVIMGSLLAFSSVSLLAQQTPADAKPAVDTAKIQQIMVDKGMDGKQEIDQEEDFHIKDGKTDIKGKIKTEREVEVDGDVEEKVVVKYEGTNAEGQEVEGKMKMKSDNESDGSMSKKVVVKEEVEGNGSEKEMKRKMTVKTDDEGEVSKDSKLKMKKETADNKMKVKEKASYEKDDDGEIDAERESKVRTVDANGTVTKSEMEIETNEDPDGELKGEIEIEKTIDPKNGPAKKSETKVELKEDGTVKTKTKTMDGKVKKKTIEADKQ